MRLLKVRMRTFLRYLQPYARKEAKLILPDEITGLINNSDLPEEYNLFFWLKEFVIETFCS